MLTVSPILSFARCHEQICREYRRRHDVLNGVVLKKEELDLRQKIKTAQQPIASDYLIPNDPRCFKTGNVHRMTEKRRERT